MKAKPCRKAIGRATRRSKQGGRTLPACRELLLFAYAKCVFSPNPLIPPLPWIDQWFCPWPGKCGRWIRKDGRAPEGQSPGCPQTDWSHEWWHCHQLWVGVKRRRRSWGTGCWCPGQYVLLLGHSGLRASFPLQKLTSAIWLHGLPSATGSISQAGWDVLPSLVLLSLSRLWFWKQNEA